MANPVTIPPRPPLTDKTTPSQFYRYFVNWADAIYQILGPYPLIVADITATAAELNYLAGTSPGTFIADHATVIGDLPTSNQSLLTCSTAGVQSWSTLASTAAQVDVTYTSGVFTFSIDSAYVGQTSITTLGTITTGTWRGTPVQLAYGGTNANLSASNGGIFYSTSTAGAILSGTATARQMLQSGASTTPAWSTTTWPATTTANQILYSSATNVIGQITTAANGTLVTDGSSIPTISSTLPTAVQSNITQVGTIASGTWNGSLITGTYGGTGVNNGSYTITVGGNVSTSGGSLALTMSGATALTLPTSGTVLTLSGGTMTGNLILNGDPSTGLQAATKQYVDSLGSNTKQACYCATTANMASVTYSNGASGVGATLTNSGAMAAFTADGTSPAVNARVLVKNQTNDYQNGIYTLTTVGSGAVNWVLTRATDYDSTTEVVAGSSTFIQNGTVNQLTTWVENLTVTAIGAGNSITFVAASTSGTVTNVTGTSPVTVTNGSTTPNITLGSGSNGALLIGTGSGYSSATITAGSNVTVTNGSGSITIAAASFAPSTVWADIAQVATWGGGF